jgi:glycosyltransferase involved in cell wall biosynthesis
MASKDGVSVIICCHNSASRLPETLKHLAKQRLSPSTSWEVILVNNASTDDTAAVASAGWLAEGTPAPMRIVDEPTPGLSYARERGIATSQYDILVCLDDDNWLADDYLCLASEIMARTPDIGALGGRIDPAFEKEPPDWFFQMQSEYAVGPQSQLSGDITKGKCHLAGAGMVLRKTAFLELKEQGFDFILRGRTGSQLTSGEDTELCFALALSGYRIWYDDRLRLVHFIPATRLVLPFVYNLIRNNELSAPVIACYETALREAKPTAWHIYYSGLRKRSGWMTKSLMKFLLGRQQWIVCRFALLQWWQSLLNLSEALRVYRGHFSQILRLRENKERNAQLWRA